MSQKKAKLKRKLEGWVRPEEPERPRDDEGNLILNSWRNFILNRKRNRQVEFYRDRSKSKKGAKHKVPRREIYPEHDPAKSNKVRLKERREFYGRD